MVVSRLFEPTRGDPLPLLVGEGCTAFRPNEKVDVLRFRGLHPRQVTEFTIQHQGFMSQERLHDCKRLEGDNDCAR